MSLQSVCVAVILALCIVYVGMRLLRKERRCGEGVGCGENCPDGSPEGNACANCQLRDNCRTEKD